MRRFFSSAIILLFCTVFLFLTACKGRDSFSKKSKSVPAVPVKVGTAVQKDVPVELRAIGNVEAYSTVSLKSRVDGQLSAVYFQEGRDVKKGELLFLIDPRPFEEAVRQVEANLVRDTVQAENAGIDVQRYDELFKEELVSKQQYDKVRTNYEALKAIVKADKAALENARLQLQYCYLRSPIDGRIGSILVHQGNMIRANDTVMAVINQISPIYVSFSVPEQELIRIKKAMSAKKLKTEAIIQGSETYSTLGELVFMNNAVDPSTGTIMLKAAFPNKDKMLWPGQFVNVSLTLGIQRNAIVIPHQAVQTGQEGQHVFIVRSDNTVELRPVVTGMRYNQEIVIEKGIQAGEVVVTDGQIRLVSGAKIEIKK
ncbi:RND transporter [Dissulfurispira thermophila]|uniref:RND transporter n=1 Tax=Dissulfurispira thermophila TaxID=2715679 RepID=A0A7G1H271_9BACT|nr:efflux RND transporter periplasmic adaptor subunit [Dissulfurispira thermophila]BCB96748.1 RND transporter [Dissulfurispira thermophila]